MDYVKFLFGVILIFCVSCQNEQDYADVDELGITGFIEESGVDYRLEFLTNYSDGRYLDSKFANLMVSLNSNKWGEENLALVIEKPGNSGVYGFDFQLFVEDYLDDHIVNESRQGLRQYAILKLNNSTIDVIDIKGYKGISIDNAIISQGSIASKADCTDWFLVTKVNGTIVGEQYVGTTCACGGDSAGSTETQCNGGGGGSGGRDPRESDTPPDCESFPYYKNMNNNLHVTGVHKLNLHYANFTWGSSGGRGGGEVGFSYHSYTFESIVYFDAPFHLMSGTAANLTAEAIESVNERLEEIYGASGFPSPNVLEGTIMRLLNEEMGSWGGRASLRDNGTPNSNIGIYNETWLPRTCN